MLPVKFSGRLWLNGEFGVSRQREALFSAHRENDYHCPIHKQVMASLVADWGVSAVLDWVLRGTNRTVADLGLSKVPNSHKVRATRGSGGITSLGRKMLRNACTLLQRENQHFRLSFLTLTVPRCTMAEYAVVAENWSEITRQYQQYLRRRLAAKGLTGELVTCSEIQEERYENTGVPCLHLHIVFRGKCLRGASWAVTPKDCAKGWKRILSRFLPGARDWSACENLRMVRKSASAYLGKYMSKGAQAVQSLKDKGLVHMLPSAWWNCTLSLRKRVLAAGASGYRIGDLLIKLIDNGHFDAFDYLAPIKLPVKKLVDGVWEQCGEYLVGWSGRLKASAAKELLDKHGKISW